MKHTILIPALLILQTLAANAQFDPTMAKSETFTAYAACVRKQAVRLSPSAEPVAVVIEAAKAACDVERAAYNKSLGSDPTSPDMMAFAEQFATHFATLDVVETRAHLKLSVPPFGK